MSKKDKDIVTGEDDFDILGAVRDLHKGSEIVADDPAVLASASALASGQNTADEFVSNRYVNDPDNPDVENGFKVCKNEMCSVRHGCLRFRLRKSRRDAFPALESMFHNDQDKCHISIEDESHKGRFALDPIQVT